MKGHQMRRPGRSLCVAGVVCCGLVVPIVRPLHAQSTRAPFHLLEATIDDVRAALTARRLTCRDLVGQYLARIDAYNRRGPNLNAVETINAQALAEADQLDAAMAASAPLGPLHCIPMLVKDELNTAGLATAYGSAAFSGYVPSTDATVVARLKAAGAIILAKATMGEFASGYVSSISGAIRNPYDPARHASGSSGGTGAGIAANFATVGIGEDTGGSIRGPAAVASLVGLRPTVPLVSRAGLFPARPTTDTIGPIARTVKDAAIVLNVIAGFDARDPTTAASPRQTRASYVPQLSGTGLSDVRLGVLREPQDGRTDVDSAEYRAFRRVSDRAIARMQALGAVVDDVPAIPDLARRLDQDFDGNVFETEAAVDRFLAGESQPPFTTLREILLSGRILPSRATTLMESVNRTVADAGYARIRQDINELTQHVLSVMQEHRLDAFVYPTADLPPSRVASDAMTNPRTGGTRLGSNRRLASVMAFPAITVPAGFTDEGIPVGIEWLGAPFSEAQLLTYAYAFERATHHRHPPSLTPALEAP